MEYYLRQMCLPEVGESGQRKLGKAKCLVVGAGGLGCPVLSYLTAAGVGTIGICDFDRVEITNLHRQVLYTVEDIGEPKAEVAARKLSRANPYVEFLSYPTKATVLLCQAYDLVLDCTDNFQTKFFLNDCAYLHQIPLIRAAIYRFEGQMQFYLPKRDDACLRCLWKEVPEEGCVGSCTEVGVLGPLPGFFGTLQAMEAIKFFLGMPLLSSLLLYDLISHEQKKISLLKNPHCPLCGNNPSIHHAGSSWEVHVREINLKEYILVDIREQKELQQQSLTNWEFQHIPLSTFDENRICEQKPYLFFCQKGRRSYNLVHSLRKKGFENVFSLMGGIDQLENK